MMASASVHPYVNYLNCLNIAKNKNSKVCRVCMLADTKGVISLFALFNGSDKICNKVMEVANIQISETDSLPKWICYSCLVHLETSYQFKIQAEKSDVLLKKQLDISNDEEGKTIMDTTDEAIQGPSQLRGLLTEQRPPDNSGCEGSNQGFSMNDHSDIQGHFLTVVQSDCNSNADNGEENGIKITSVMSQAQSEEVDISDCLTNPELDESSHNDVEMTNKKSNCTCAERQDGMKCDACLKMPDDSISSSKVESEGRNELNEEEPFLKFKTVSRNRHKCNICDKGFRHRSHLDLHMLAHNDDESTVPKSKGQHKCPLCDQGFQFKSLLRVHLLSHNGLRPYKCDMCEKSFLFEDHLANHKLHHIKERTLKCELCDKTFKHKIHLSNHMITHKDQSGVCEHCGKFYLSYSGLHVHQLIHHSDDNKKTVQCEQCGKSFASLAFLKKHVRRHELAPVACEICNKIYPNRMRLSTHKTVVHFRKPKHKCTDCNKVFKHRATLRIHIESKHSDKERLKCDICDVTFAQKASLQTHIRILHKGLKPHVCKHCNEEFKWKQTRDKHEFYYCLQNKNKIKQVSDEQDESN